MTTPITLHADQEHGGLRTAVLILILVFVWLSYQLIYWLIQQFGGSIVNYAAFLSCVLGLPLGVGLVWLVELQLKRIWHSGSSITLDGDQVLFGAKTGERAQFQINGDLAVTTWYFPLGNYPRIGNERRVKKQWYCLACQLQQDEARLVVYGFMSPKETAVFTNTSMRLDFHEIRPEELYNRKRGLMRMPNRPDIPPEVLRGKDGRYWLAERRRWSDGFELTARDFNTFISYIQPTEEEQTVISSQ